MPKKEILYETWIPLLEVDFPLEDTPEGVRWFKYDNGEIHSWNSSPKDPNADLTHVMIKGETR